MRFDHGVADLLVDFDVFGVHAVFLDPVAAQGLEGARANMQSDAVLAYAQLD